MASMLGRAALRSLSGGRRSALLLAGRRNASGSVLSELGGTNAAIIAVGVGVLGVSLYSVSCADATPPLHPAYLVVPAD